MMGVLGIGGNILAWPPADLELARQKVALYKRIRPTVQHGRQFWLADPGTDEPSAVQYVSEDRAQTVVLAYQVRGRLGRGHRRIHLRGLDPARHYRRVDTGSGAPTSSSTGAALMGAGLPLFADRPLNALDWLSEIQLWETTGA
jgi:alpha-galactosidase